MLYGQSRFFGRHKDWRERKDFMENAGGAMERLGPASEQSHEVAKGTERSRTVASDFHIVQRRKRAKRKPAAACGGLKEKRRNSGIFRKHENI